MVCHKKAKRHSHDKRPRLLGLGSWGGRCIAPDGSTSGWNPARDSDELGVAAQASRNGKASHAQPASPPSIWLTGALQKGQEAPFWEGCQPAILAHPRPPIWVVNHYLGLVACDSSRLRNKPRLSYGHALLGPTLKHVQRFPRVSFFLHFPPCLVSSSQLV